MPDPVSTLALATGGAFLGKFVGPAAEHLGKLALERAQQLGTKATALLTAVGREPQSVEPKLLVPLVQAASLEPDEALAEKWAALLANAADPSQSATVLPSFTEILRQLTTLEGRILQAIAAASAGQAPELRAKLYVPATRIQQEAGKGKEGYVVSFQVAIDNLIRLRLCEGRGVTRPPVGPTNTLSDLLSGHELILNQGPGKDKLAVTDLGLAFLAAVTPPTA